MNICFIKRTLSLAVLTMLVVSLLGSVAAPAQAITRNQAMMKRAQKWIKLKVPYSQKKRFGGYRMDCSGFASMVWKLSKPGATSQTIAKYGVRIKPKNLKKGDILVNKRNGHVVVFGGWVNKLKTRYWCYEEANRKSGARKRNTPFPYWSNGGNYKPYRKKA